MNTIDTPGGPPSRRIYTVAEAAAIIGIHRITLP